MKKIFGIKKHVDPSKRLPVNEQKGRPDTFSEEYLRQQLVLRDQEIIRLRNELAVKKDETDRLNNNINEQRRNKQATATILEIDERDVEISLLKEEIDNLRERLDKRDEEITKLRNVIMSVSGELSAVIEEVPARQPKVFKKKHERKPQDDDFIGANASYPESGRYPKSGQ